MRLVILKLLLFYWATASALSAAKNIGEAIRSGNEQLRLTLEAQDTAVLQLANRAFSLHGGIRLVHETQAQYRAEFAWVSDQSLRVSVRDKQGTDSLPPRLIQAASRQKAILRACDFVIESLFRRPGFFAGQLAFVVKQAAASEIYTSDMLFSQVRPVTADRSLVTGPNWQPDGRGLLYTTYFKTGFRISIISTLIGDVDRSLPLTKEQIRVRPTVLRVRLSLCLYPIAVVVIYTWAMLEAVGCVA